MQSDSLAETKSIKYLDVFLISITTCIATVSITVIAMNYLNLFQSEKIAVVNYDATIQSILNIKPDIDPFVIESNYKKITNKLSLNGYIVFDTKQLINYPPSLLVNPQVLAKSVIEAQ